MRINAPFINAMLQNPTMAPMHPSMTRLLRHAKKVTEGTAEPIQTFADLGARMEESSATLTNWKARGVSKLGALKAERLFGCSADWLLGGHGSPAIGPPPQGDPLGDLAELVHDIAQMPHHLRQGAIYAAGAAIEEFKARQAESGGSDGDVGGPPSLPPGRPSGKAPRSDR